MALSDVKNRQGCVKEFPMKDSSSKSHDLIFILDCRVWKKSGKIWMCMSHVTLNFFKHTKADSHVVP